MTKDKEVKQEAVELAVVPLRDVLGEIEMFKQNLIASAFNIAVPAREPEQEEVVKDDQ